MTRILSHDDCGQRCWWTMAAFLVVEILGQSSSMVEVMVTGGTECTYVSEIIVVVGGCD